jgi:hypothetical protein
LRHILAGNASLEKEGKVPGSVANRLRDIRDYLDPYSLRAIRSTFMNIGYLRLAALLSLLLSCRLSASIVPANDPTIIGNGNPATDANNLTRDTSTGLDWLDTTLSANLSYNQVSSQFGPGGLFEGFRYATLAEIAVFWSNAGISPVPNFFVQEDPDIPLLQSIWTGGQIVANPTNNISQAWYDDSPERPGELSAGLAILAEVFPGDQNTVEGFDFANFNDPFRNRNRVDFFTGSALIRPSATSDLIPEPYSAAVWCGLLIGGVAFVHFRRQRTRLTSSKLPN